MKPVLIPALAAGLLLCACSGQHGTAAPQATATVTATATTTSPGTQSQAATPSVPPASSQAAVTAQAGPAPCLTRYLNVSPGLSQGAAGSTYVVLEFRNLNNQPCTLYGYPGVSFGRGTPVSQVGPAAAENPATARELVTLAPHGRAGALLQIVHAADYPAASCGPVTAHWLIVYPPNQTVPVYVSYVSPACAKHVRLLTVSAVRTGSV